MRIIDSHVHLGPCRVFGLNVSEDEVLRSMDENGVEASIIQPFPGALSPKEVHDRIAMFAKGNYGRVYGLVSISPHTSRDVYFSEVERCVKDLGFVGVKLHTIGHAVSPLSEDAGMVFEAAERLKIPVMVHTGPGIPFSSPALCIPRAKEYPSLPIILAHGGFGILTAEAYVAARECGNMFIETSWLPTLDLKWLIKELGADRVMIGSDLPTNLPIEIAKLKSIGLREEELRKCLGETAAKVFKLKI